MAQFPSRTFRGRDRVSLAPRWTGNWLAVLFVGYFMISYGASLFGIDLSSVNPLLKIAGVRSAPSATFTPTFVPTPPPSSFYASSENFAPSPVAVAENTSSPIAPQSTLTPYPTQTPYPTFIPYHVGYTRAVGYSYYWPPFGPPNCSDENWKPEFSICEDATRSGERWTQWIGRAVAIPVEWVEEIPMLSLIRIYAPPYEMAGDYLVIDTCGRCVTPNGTYLDFLDNRQRLPWTYPLMMEVVCIPTGDYRCY